MKKHIENEHSFPFFVANKKLKAVEKFGHVQQKGEIGRQFILLQSLNFILALTLTSSMIWVNNNS
jgi:hypothetical protein